MCKREDFLGNEDCDGYGYGYGYGDGYGSGYGYGDGNGGLGGYIQYQISKGN